MRQLSRVAEGRLLSAQEWNRLREILAELSDMGLLVGDQAGVAPESPYEGRDCARHCVNDTGYDVPLGYLCRIEGENTSGSGILKFEKPSNGTGPVGIALEPIGADATGLVAVTGGPYRVRVDPSSDPIAQGDWLVPADGASSWFATLAAEDTPASIQAASAVDSDGYCWASFAGTTESTDVQPPLLANTSSRMTADNTPYSVQLLNADGTTEEGFVLARRVNGIYVDTYNGVGFLGKDSLGNNIFFPANLRESPEMPFMFEVRDADPTGYIAVGRAWVRDDL